ncbi:MAG TPA: phosphoribosylformylglycinamidine cyclo-ligase [Euzebyales bacterium]|nr:phosphoribosylformylglycinamidine cyclo-ligase [Euzebyales bacterium]
MDREPLTYAAAGVSLDAADAVVEAIRPHARRTARPEVAGDLGGFGGLFALDPTRWRDPLLVTSCDGVGTKLEVARALRRFDTVGQDLVAMVVDDLVACGAEPLVFNDYVAVGALDVAALEQIVSGIADGCVAAGCALVGGETAEHPGVLAPTQFDLAGFGVGIVERDAVLGPQRVCAGDELVAMASTGLHSNGYSLARRVLDSLDLHADHGLPGGAPLGDVLLRPTRIYAPHCLALSAQTEVHALCHITGGGVPGNLPRVLPDQLGAVVDTATFSPPPIFGLIAQTGPVEAAEMWRTFNMGAGMIAVVAHGRDAVDALAAHGVDAWVCGHVTAEGTGVELAGLGAPAK